MTEPILIDKSLQWYDLLDVYARSVIIPQIARKPIMKPDFKPDTNCPLWVNYSKHITFEAGTDPAK
jgi:hypothetical protein